MTDSYKIDFRWDDEANVWIATSNDIHGLILEHDTFDGLVEEVRLAVPALLSFKKPLPEEISLNFEILKTERLVISGRI